MTYLLFVKSDHGVMGFEEDGLREIYIAMAFRAPEPVAMLPS